MRLRGIAMGAPISLPAAPAHAAIGQQSRCSAATLRLGEVRMAAGSYPGAAGEVARGLTSGAFACSAGSVPSEQSWPTHFEVIRSAMPNCSKPRVRRSTGLNSRGGTGSAWPMIRLVSEHSRHTSAIRIAPQLGSPSLTARLLHSISHLAEGIRKSGSRTWIVATIRVSSPR